MNTDFKVFTVASNIGAAGYVDGYDLIMHKHWASNEAMISSTWREVKAIQLSLDSFKHLLRNSSVTFVTDNQNAACIVKKESKIPELQALALWI